MNEDIIKETKKVKHNKQSKNEDVNVNDKRKKNLEDEKAAASGGGALNTDANKRESIKIDRNGSTSSLT